MDELDAFIAFLKDEHTKSTDDYTNDERANAIDAYNGEVYGDEEDGRSQVVTRDVAEVVDYMTISLLRTMVSGDRVVEFEYADKALAEQATLAVSRTFFQGRRGYRFLHDWIKAGLLEKTSVAKVLVEPGKAERIEEEVPAEALQLLDGQMIEAEPLDEAETMWRVAYTKAGAPVFRDYVVPNEQCSFAQDATDLDDDCVYVDFAHERTLSQLAQMGFVTDDLTDEGPADTASTLSDSRNPGRDWTYASRTGANRKVTHHEEYSRFDLDGDGIAELILSHRVGSRILTRADTGELAIEVIDEQPGVVWCPFPMQHRIVGQSLADKVMDIQRVNTVLMRQGLDNLYQTNSPRFAIHEQSIGDSTIDDLLSPRPAGVVRWTGAVPPTPITLPFAAQSAFDVMEVMRGEKANRTGITPLNQGIDADVMNRTATGTALLQAQGQQVEEYCARNFAEAFARLMLKKYNLMRRYGEPFEMVVDGETVVVDPRAWPDDMEVVVRVGLGTGRKDQRIAYRMQLLEVAQAAIQGGSRIFNDTNLYNNLKGLVADTNLGSARDLLTDPDTLGEEPEQADPAALKAQAEAMLQAEKLEAGKQESAVKLELQRDEAAARIQLMREEAAARIDLEREKAAAQADLAVRQQDFEMAMAREQMALQREQAVHKADLDERTAVSKQRPGGDLDK